MHDDHEGLMSSALQWPFGGSARRTARDSSHDSLRSRRSTLPRTLSEYIERAWEDFALSLTPLAVAPIGLALLDNPRGILTRASLLGFWSEKTGLITGGPSR